MIVAISFLLGFLGTGFYSYSRGIFLPSLAETLSEGNRMQISIGFSLGAIVMALIAPRLGAYLDRGSPRLVILIGITIVTVSYLLLGQVQTLWQFYLIIGLGMGGGVSCMGGLAWHRLIIYWFDHWRGRAIALAVMGASVAGIMMPPLVTLLVDEYGWRTGYNLFAISTFTALLPLVYFFMKDRPQEIDEVRDGHRYRSSITEPDPLVLTEADARIWTWQELIASPAFWSIGLIFGSMTCVFAAVMLHLYGHILDIGFSTIQASYVLSTAALFAALGKPVIGFLSDFFGARISIWLSLACQAAALLAFASADTLSSAFVAAGLYGFGYSGMSPLRTFSISTSISSASFALANGVLRWVELPFILSASPLAGYIYDVTGSYNQAFMILAGLLCVAAIGPFFIRVGGAVERKKAATSSQ
jgi:MFS family permease